MTVGNPDWLGITPLSTSRVAIQQSGVVIPSASSQSFTTPIQGLGYEIYLSIAQSTVQVVNSPVRIRLDWTDKTTGIVTERQSWWVLAGTVNFPHIIIGHGPSAANTLSVSVLNAGATAPSITVSLDVLDVSRTYARHDLRTDDNIGVAYSDPATPAIDSDILAGIMGEIVSVSIPAAQTINQVMPLYSGQIQVKQFAGASGIQVLVRGVGYVTTAYNQTIAEIDTGANVTAYNQVYLPRIQQELRLTNPDGANPVTPLVFAVVPLE